MRSPPNTRSAWIPAPVTLAQIFAAAACVVALALRWPTLQALVHDIDHGDLLFADFVNHYYPTAAEKLREGAPAGGFFYPAAFAAMLAPIGLLPLGAAEVAWGAVQVGCLVVAATACVRAAARENSALATLGTALTVTSVPVLHNLKWGQVSLPIFACACGGMVLYARGWRTLAAALLAVAVGIKGYPLLFFAWFVARGDMRFVLRGAVASALVFGVLPAVVMGPSHALFVQRVSTDAVLAATEGIVRDFNSQYAPAVFARYQGGWDALTDEMRAAAELRSFTLLPAIAILAVIAARSTAPSIAARREILGFVLVASSVPFWLRTSWSHYFVHLPVAQTMLAGMFAERGRARGALAILLLVAPSVFLSSVLGLFATRGWWYYATAGNLFFADVLVLVGCAVAVLDAHFTEGAPLGAQLVRSLRTVRLTSGG